MRRNKVITTENLKKVLIEMEFSKKKEIFERFYPDFNCYMKVDFKNKKLIYPSEVIGNRNNTAFLYTNNYML